MTDVFTKVAADYDGLAGIGLPREWEAWVLERYGLDVSSEYAGMPIRNPFGKASGQLSMNAGQVRDDVEAGLGFVVLKTLIAQDAAGSQSMQAWAIREARMDVEPIRGQSGETGWTVTWKGRGWWQSFDDYLKLVRDSQSLAAAAIDNRPATRIVPSVKYHLPTQGELWRIEEYEHTTRKLLEAWRSTSESGAASEEPMPLEKDFSPTLAGSDRSAVRETVLAWLRETPRLIREAVPAGEVRVGLKMFNALFDDEFQLDMLRTIATESAERPDFFVYGNRLFDPRRTFEGHQGVAYGGPDLSDRNLRVMRRAREEGMALPPGWSATGNIDSGRRALDYAALGAASFQMHTLFQLPLDQYRLKVGSRSQRTLFELLLHPDKGIVVEAFRRGRVLQSADQTLRFQDLIGFLPPTSNQK